MPACFSLIALSLSYQDMSDGERYIYHALTTRIEQVDTKITRIETRAESTEEKLANQRATLREHREAIAQLREFRSGLEGRITAAIAISSVLAGLVMSFINRRAAINSKKRGGG